MAKPIIIDNFQRGIGSSSHTGFQMMKNMDIDTIWGVARPSFKAVDQDEGLAGNPLKFVQDYPSNHLYTIEAGSNRNVVRRSTNAGGTWGTITNNTQTGQVKGMEFWKDTLILFRDNGSSTLHLDGYDGSWNNSFETVSFSGRSAPDYYPSIIGQDDILYIGDGPYVQALQEDTDFDSGAGGTYTHTPQALDLPEDFIIRSFAEYGQNLLIGANRENDTQNCYVFVWDRTSQSFSSQIAIPDNTLHSLFTYRGSPYAACGQHLRIYQLSLDRYQLITEFPKDSYLNDTSGNPQAFTSGLTISPFSFMQLRNKLYFGYGGQSQPALPPQGVYSFNGRRFVHENTISAGDGETTNTQDHVSCIYPINEYQYLIGWKYVSTAPATTYGIDKVGLGNLHSGTQPTYGGYIDTPFYSVGTAINKRTFKSIEVHLTRPNKGIAIAYRTAKNDSFTTIKDFDSTTYTGETFEFTGMAVSADNIQFRIGLNSSAAAPTELLRIIVK